MRHVLIDPMDHQDLWNEYQTRREQGVTSRRALREALDALANEPTPRAIAVIDPESGEDQERFRQMAVNYIHGDWTLAEAVAGLAPKPKPEEPTGLGAVVEDAEGRHWVHVGPGGSFPVWAPADEEDNRIASSYDTITAVRILSPGVTS